MHNHGISGDIQHFRKATELPLLLERRVYNYRYQYFQDTKMRKVKSGDFLQMNCNYDTHNINGILYAGMHTSKEMCVFYFMYFPKLTVNAQNIVVNKLGRESVYGHRKNLVCAAKVVHLQPLMNITSRMMESRPSC